MWMSQILKAWYLLNTYIMEKFVWGLSASTMIVNYKESLKGFHVYMSFICNFFKKCIYQGLGDSRSTKLKRVLK